MRHRRPALEILLLTSGLLARGQTSECAACHPKIAATYAKTGMARSFYSPQSVENTRFYHEKSDTWYAMERRGGDFYQRRWRIGYDGKETETDESKIDYVMGSGNRVRTYLHRTERGALIELPLAWYSENGGTWAMNPGHDRDYALPPREVAYECMFCHNSYPRIPPGHDEPGSEPLYAGALPEGIDCERCHGPGANHIRAAKAPAAKIEDVRKAILNPARLSRDRQMEVCMQCHLETTSLQLPHSIQKYGRGPFSYNPAESLSNFIIFFDHAPGSKYQDDFEIAHSAYRLRKSKCFLNSAMTCITCHNPHEAPLGDGAAAHFNDVCRQCHNTGFKIQHTASPDCITCHMPKRRTTDVVHAVMTDHYIQRRPAAGDPLAPIPERAPERYKGEVVQYYPPQRDALYLAVANGLPRLAAEIQLRKPARPEFYIELGQDWLAAGNRANAIRAFEEAVRREPDSTVALLDLGDALTQAGDTKRAAEVLNHGLKVAPDDPLLWYQIGLATNSIGAFAKSDLPEARNMAGTLMAASGDMDGAEKAFRDALRAYPDLADAQGNLGHLLSARSDLPQAAWYFARAVRLKPADAEIRINYAVTLAGLNRFGESQRQIEAALKADPRSAQAHNFLGTLLAHANQPDAALREFLEALRWNPAFGLAHLNAAGVLAARGDTGAARLHWQQAARDADPQIRERALQSLKGPR